MIRKLISLAALLIFTIGIAGCSGGTDTGGTTAGNEDPGAPTNTAPNAPPKRQAPGNISPSPGEEGTPPSDG